MNRISYDRFIAFCRSSPSIVACGALVGGILLGRWLAPGAAMPSALTGLCLMIAAAVLHWLDRRHVACWCALAAVGAIGTAHQLVQTPPTHDALSLRLSGERWQPLVFRATIESAPVWRPNAFHRPENPDSQSWRTQWDVLCEEIRDGRHWKPIRALCSLSVDGRVNRFLPGDKVEVYGSASCIRAPSNPGEQDLREYYRQRRQFVVLRCEQESQIRLMETGSGYSLYRALAHISGFVDRVVHRWVTLDQAPLAAALVFGQRQQVDWEDQQQLLATGTLHMLSISGMHVEMVALAIVILCLLLRFPIRVTLVIVSALIVFYAFVTGSNPPVIRATLLVLCACLARWLGRRTKLSNLLAFAAIAVLAIRAAWLPNVGVQLSFLAVAAIALFAPNRNRKSQRRGGLRAAIEEGLPRYRQWLNRSRRWLMEMGMISLWVWLITAPLIWSNFHVVSPIAVPLNVALWPLLMIGLLSGLVLCVVAWLPPAAWLAGWVCGISLWLITEIVRIAETIPLAYIWAPTPPVWWMVIFYSIIVAWFTVRGLNSRRIGILVSVLLAWLMIGMTPWIIGNRGQGPNWLRSPRLGLASEHSQELVCTFIDVGHGTSVVLELPNGEVWLYDAGHLGAGDQSHQDIAAVLWHLKTARIHRLFISHADADHYNAIPGLLKRFAVGQVVAPEHVWSHSSPEVAQLRSAIEVAMVPGLSAASGDIFRVGNSTIEVLHPAANWRGETDNAASLCLLLAYAGRLVLLTGDIERDGIELLAGRPPISCDVLMAPHHGSLSHDPEPLLAWCRPQNIIISGAQRSVRQEVIDKFARPGSDLAITFRDGAIQFRISENGNIEKYHWHPTGWRMFDR